MRTSISMVAVFGFVALALGVGSIWLGSNARAGYLSPAHPEPKKEAAALLAPAYAPAVAVATLPPERQLVNDDRIQELIAENDALRARIAALEASLCPKTQAQLAIALALPEADVQHYLDRSELLPSADVLGEALRAAGSKSTWEALQAESAWYRAQADFRLKNQKPEDRTGAIQWHQSAFVPFFSNGLATLCDRLYAMGMPSTIVEPFRSKQTEGI